MKFGQRAKTIKNTISINQQRSVEELNAIINKLNKELEGLKKYVSVLEIELLNANATIDLDSLKRSVGQCQRVIFTPDRLFREEFSIRKKAVKMMSLLHLDLLSPALAHLLLQYLQWIPLLIRCHW